MAPLSRPGPPVLERPTREDLVVLTQAVAPPHWTETWCKHTDRPLVTRHLTTQSPHGAPTGLLRAVADLAGHHILLTRAAGGHAAPNRVVAALGDLPRDAGVLAEAEACAEHLNVPLVLIHGVPLAFAERSVGLEQALDHGGWLLDTAEQQVMAGAPRLEVTPRLVRTRAHELVTDVPDNELLVLGMSHHSTRPAPHLAGMSAINFAPGPILFVPTYRFTEPDGPAVPRW
ncbi:hypothetical protein GCM10023321_47900 [Pseudonocardia eucalypti]|uniref:Universal stress protein family protein n=1 Tax=Pseudonocardia eucalypti TaxID=648755 RepID=A0ABP9QIB9_9PSEU|nr:hypothetical protein [Pseudonocardia eucalypti]